VLQGAAPVGMGHPGRVDMDRIKSIMVRPVLRPVAYWLFTVGAFEEMDVIPFKKKKKINTGRAEFENTLTSSRAL
jgi:hypothetical protein